MRLHMSIRMVLVRNWLGRRYILQYNEYSIYRRHIVQVVLYSLWMIFWQPLRWFVRVSKSSINTPREQAETVDTIKNINIKRALFIIELLRVHLIFQGSRLFLKGEPTTAFIHNSQHYTAIPLKMIEIRAGA